LTYSIEAGTAQILVYMLGSANGGTWIFVKAVKCDISHYAISDGFLIQKSSHFSGFLKVLKHIDTLHEN